MTSKTILVVEDEPDFQKLIRHILEQEGYETFMASNGAQGLKVLKERVPDMILLDIRLPDMDGYEICRIIRSNPRHGRVPIIMVTIESEVKNIVRGLKIGADDYIIKPFVPEELLARVKGLFRQIEKLKTGKNKKESPREKGDLGG